MLNIQLTNKRDYNSKDKFGTTYWDQAAAIKVLEKAENLENIKKDMKQIVLNSDVREILLNIEGSGDSGGIEETLLYDKHENALTPKYEYTKIVIPVNHEPGSKTVIKPYTNKWEQTDTKNLYTVPEALSDVTNHITTGKIISSTPEYDINNVKIGNEYYVYKENVSNIDIPWPTWGADNLYWKNEFPSIRLSWNSYSRTEKPNHPFQSLMEYAYEILPGGWEINEGSNSVVSFKYNDDGTNTSKETYNDNNFKISVDFNQVVYETNEHSWEINAGPDYYKIMSTELKKENIKNRTINMNSEQQSSKFYRIVKQVEKAMESDA